MNADGSNQTRITNNDFDEQLAQVSPDGTTIVFHVHLITGRTGRDIFTIGIDGENLTNLTNGEHSGEHPTWSPDGTKISYTTYEHATPFSWEVPTEDWKPPNPEIHVMDSDGSNKIRITDNTEQDYEPSWAP